MHYLALPPHTPQDFAWSTSKQLIATERITLNVDYHTDIDISVDEEGMKPSSLEVKSKMFCSYCLVHS